MFLPSKRCYFVKIWISFVVLPMLLFASGCATTPQPSPEMVTVEGSVRVRGNEPFTAVMLETEEQNQYVLALTGEQRHALSSPTRARVTGRLYKADWNGRPYAHIEVTEVVPLSVNTP